jgi:hypothetical protein
MMMMMMIPNIIPFSANFSFVIFYDCKKESLVSEVFMKVLSAVFCKSAGKAYLSVCVKMLWYDPDEVPISLIKLQIVT